MSYLLDTNLVSELRKGARCNRGVASWFAATADDELCLSVLVLGELRRGIEAIRLRDRIAAQALDRWCRMLGNQYADRILPIDARIADEWGRLNAASPVTVVDGLLAATALVHDLTLVTRNTRDVAGTGARLLNPFAPELREPGDPFDREFHGAM